MAKLTSLIVNDTGSLTLPNGTLAQRTSITPTVVSFTTVTTTTWTAPANVTQVEVLVVAGGGGGGYALNNGLTGGGGGAGGLLYNAAYPVTPGTSYTVTVGGGGAGSTTAGSQGTNGGNSVFAGLTAIGGGGGGSYQSSPYTSRTGVTGGSGGGGASNILYAPGGSGTLGQGFGGGSGTDLSGNDGSGGGGGAGGPGTAGYDSDYTSGGGGQGGQGGPGLWFNISGTPTAYAGGGGGTGTLLQGLGGVGGGGAGGTIAGSAGSNGASNTGGGGGGGSGYNGGTGGSGIVILRYSLVGTSTAQAETRFNTNTNTIENFSSNQWQIAPVTAPGFVTSDLVVNLEASRYASGSTWYDLSPVGNNATLNSATFTTTGGASLQFSGATSSNAVVANSVSLMSNQISFEIWIYFNTIAGGDIMEFGVGSGSYGQYYFRISGSNFEVGHSGINNPFYLDTTWPTSNISTGVWYCMSYSANTDLKYGQLFVNGSPVATASVSTQTTVSTFTPNAMNIGGYTWDGGVACNIASFKLWNKTLTPAEIRQNYNAHSQRPYFTNKGLQPEQAAIIRDPSLVFNLDSYDPQSINISNTNTLIWYDTAGGQQCALNTTSRDPWQYQNNSGLQFNVINSGENVSLQQISGLGTPTSAFPFTMIAVASNTTNWTPANGTTQMLMNMSINGQRIMLGCAQISSVGGLFFGGTAQYQGGVNALQGGVLYHVAFVVYSASGDGRLGLYVNGEQQALTQTSSSAVGGTAGWSIASNAASGEYWTGKIASIQVYNRLLTNKEIQQNYQAARQRYGLP